MPWDPPRRMQHDSGIRLNSSFSRSVRERRPSHYLEEEVFGAGLSELRELRQLREENSKLKPGRTCSADQGAQENRAAEPRASALTDPAERKVEHGFCRRPPARRALVPGAYGGRSAHARMPLAPGRQLAHRPEGG